MQSIKNQEKQNTLEKRKLIHSAVEWLKDASTIDDMYLFNFTSLLSEYGPVLNDWMATHKQDVFDYRLVSCTDDLKDLYANQFQNIECTTIPGVLILNAFDQYIVIFTKQSFVFAPTCCIKQIIQQK